MKHYFRLLKRRKFMHFEIQIKYIKKIYLLKWSIFWFIGIKQNAKIKGKNKKIATNQNQKSKSKNNTKCKD